jgi:hypothetical protein
MTPWRVCWSVVADSHHIDEEQDLDPQWSEKLGSDPYYSENMVPDPQESNADPQLSLWHCSCKHPYYGTYTINKNTVCTVYTPVSVWKWLFHAFFTHSHTWKTHLQNGPFFRKRHEWRQFIYKYRGKFVTYVIIFTIRNVICKIKSRGSTSNKFDIKHEPLATGQCRSYLHKLDIHY